MRSLVRISCAVTSCGRGRRSTLPIRTVRPTCQKACRPGGKPLDELPIDEQQASLVCLDDRLHRRCSAHIELINMPLRDPRLPARVDDFDIDLGQCLPEGACGVRQRDVLRLPVKGDDGHLVRLRVHDLEMPRRKRRLCLGEHQRAIGRNFGTNDLHDLGSQPSAEVEFAVAARLEQPVETAIPEQESALVIAHDDGVKNV